MATSCPNSLGSFSPNNYDLKTMATLFKLYPHSLTPLLMTKAQGSRHFLGATFNGRVLDWAEDKKMQALLLVTNKQQVDSSVESAEYCTHFWTWKVRLPVAAQPHAEHHFTGKHFCVLWFLTGSGLTAEAACQLRSPRKSRTSSIWAWSTKFCAVGCSGQEPMFTIPWVGMAGLKSLCTCWQWPLTFACFQSSSQVNPLGSVCTGVSQKKYLSLKATQQVHWGYIGFWFQLECPMKH